jgi:hypothetical protein
MALVSVGMVMGAAPDEGGFDGSIASKSGSVIHPPSSLKGRRMDDVCRLYAALASRLCR